MPVCDNCGNDYDKAFQIIKDGKTHTSTVSRCAIARLAPVCEHRQVRIIGHGMESKKLILLRDHCAEKRWGRRVARPDMSAWSSSSCSYCPHKRMAWVGSLAHDHGHPTNAVVDTIQVDPILLSVSGDLHDASAGQPVSGNNWDGIPYRSYESSVLFDCASNTARYQKSSSTCSRFGWASPTPPVSYPSTMPRWMLFGGVEPLTSASSTPPAKRGAALNEAAAAAGLDRGRAGADGLLAPVPVVAQPRYAPYRRHAGSGAGRTPRVALRRPAWSSCSCERRACASCEQNRLASELPVDASGPALGRPLSGSVDLDFALP